MPIITTTMLRYDPVTFVVSVAQPVTPPAQQAAPRPEPLGRVLGTIAVAAFVGKTVEALAALSLRPR